MNFFSRTLNVSKYIWQLNMSPSIFLNYFDELETYGYMYCKVHSQIIYNIQNGQIYPIRLG